MLVIVACANGLRTIARCSIPGRTMLSVQRVRPVISRWSSLRRRSRPISLRVSSAGASWTAVTTRSPRRAERPSRCCGSPCSGTGCPRGPSRISSSEGCGFSFSRSMLCMIIPGVQNPHWRPWHSRNASCTGCSSPLLREALDGGHLGPVRLDREHVARLHAGAVEVDRAGAAVAGVAADHGAGLAETLAEVLHQQHPRFDVVGDLGAVDGEVDPGHRVSPRSVVQVTLGSDGWRCVGRSREGLDAG